LTAAGITDRRGFIDTDEQWSAQLPSAASGDFSGDGAWVTDVSGRRYVDFLGGYSALNFGHRHPALVAAATEQLGRVTLTSRAFHHTLLGPLCSELAELTGTEMVLSTNTGAEAVESTIKVARLWPIGSRAFRTAAPRWW
jgi:ornithine--oxo-acid transaminase